MELASAQAEIVRLKATLKEAESAAAGAAGGGSTPTGSSQASVAPPKQWTPADDLLLEFNAEAELVPKVQDPIPKGYEAALNTLAALFTAVPWGAQLPALTFGQINVMPSMIHTMIGDQMWTECWGERHDRISGHNFVPTKMVTVLKWITEQATLHLAKTAVDQGVAQYAAVAKEAVERRRGGSPY